MFHPPFYADDQTSESESTLADIEVEITVDQIGSKNAAMLLGAKVDENGVLVWNRDDQAPYVAFGYQGSESVMHIRMCGSRRGSLPYPKKAGKQGRSISTNRQNFLQNSYRVIMTETGKEPSIAGM
ncbi:hypothetical protein P7H20_10410 [Paenibacillus larvae]|nr:major tail protein [Paenibacillus larvae]MDT2275165.1 hypothetical protein [Paenibacillus larvae]